MSGMSHRCQVCYLLGWYFLQIPSEGRHGNNATPACASSEKSGKVVTIVSRSFHQNTPVITCQQKRKESPADDPRLWRWALTCDPEAVFCKLRHKRGSRWAGGEVGEENTLQRFLQNVHNASDICSCRRGHVLSLQDTLYSLQVQRHV